MQVKSYTTEQIDLYRQKHFADDLRTTDTNGKTGTWGGAKDYFLEYSKDKVLRLDTFLKGLKINSILDFGCGKGLAADTIKQTFPHIDVRKYDPVFDEFSLYPTGVYDLVLCFLVIHLADEENKQRIANELTSLSSRYVVLTALVDKTDDDNYYPSLFPEFKVRLLKRWQVNLPIPSHRGNDCITLILEKTS